MDKEFIKKIYDALENNATRVYDSSNDQQEEQTMNDSIDDYFDQMLKSIKKNDD